MISNSAEVVNFNWLFLKLNWFICNQLFILPDHWWAPLSAKYWRLVTDYQLSLRNNRFEVHDFRRFTDHFRGMCRIHLKWIKQNWKMATYNQLDLESQMPVLPRHRHTCVNLKWSGRVDHLPPPSKQHTYGRTLLVHNSPEVMNFNQLFLKLNWWSVANCQFFADSGAHQWSGRIDI